MSPLNLDDVLGIRFPSAGRWSPNPQPPLLAFTWDDGGVVDLYVTGAGAGAEADPVRISAGQGRVDACDWAPDGRSLVFVEDGDLKGAYFDVSSAGTVVRLLVGGLGASEPHHSPDGAYVAFVAGGRVGVFGRSTGGLSLFAVPGEAAGGWYGDALAWSPDGRHLAVNVVDGEARHVLICRPDGEVLWRTHGPGLRSHIGWAGPSRVFFADTDGGYRRRAWYVYDLTANALTAVALEHDDRHLSTVKRPVPSPDGTRLLFTLRHPGWDHLYLRELSAPGWPAAPPEDLDPDVNAHLVQLTDGACEDTGHAYDLPAWLPDGRHVVFASNRDTPGQRRLWILDAAAAPAPTAPRRLTQLEGNSVQPVVSPDGRYLAFVHSGPYRSPDLWLLELDPERAEPAGEPAPLTRSMPAAWTAEVQQVPRPVRFPASDGFEVPGYLLVPDRPEGERCPAIVWLHGGPMRQMRLGWHPMPSYALFDAFNQWFVQHGYVVLSVNYRGGIGYGKDFEQANHRAMLQVDLDDVVAAARFLRTLDFVDPDRVGVYGLSYGGYLTLGALTKHPGVFRMGINIAGIWDEAQWCRWADARYPGAAAYFRAKLGPEHEHPEVWRQASPRNFVQGLDAPLVNFHGTADANVDFAQLDAIIRDCLEHGKLYEAHYYPDEAHVFRWRKTWRDALPRILDAFERHLRGGGGPAA